MLTVAGHRARVAGGPFRPGLRRGWASIGLGAVAGLTLARQYIESTGIAWPWGGVVSLAAGATAAGGLTVYVVVRRHRPLPLPTAGLMAAPLLLYAAWPAPGPFPWLGWLALLVSALTGLWRLAERPWPERADAILGMSVFAGSLVLYIRTLAPSVLGADSGEFQFVPYVLGIAHPPGYPLYTMVGYLFSHLPLISPAYGMNLMSAFWGALAVALLYGIVVEVGTYLDRRDERRDSWLSVRIAALLAAGVFALTPTWWGQATIAAVRTMTGALLALALWLALRWWSTRDVRWLAAGVAAFTLGFTHHVSLVAAGLALLLLALAGGFWRGMDRRRWASMAICALAPLAVYLYLPVRSAIGSPFDASHPTTWDKFLELVLAQGFRGDMFHYGWEDMPQRSELLRQLLLIQLGPLGLALAAIGFVALLVRNRPAALLLGTAAAVNITMGITYRAPVIADYLIPAYLLLCAMLGVALAALLAAAGWAWQRLAGDRSAAGALAGLLGLALLTPGVSLFPSLDMSGYREVESFATQALEAASPGSVILTDWFSSTALWYYQLAEGRRSDVEVKYVSPEGGGLPWAKRAAEEVPVRPTYLTSYDPQTAERYRLMPAGPLAEVRTEPSFELPPGVVPWHTELDGQVRLAGYRLEGQSVQPGETLRLTLYWQALRKMDRSYTVFLHLADTEGNVWGQRDGAPVRGRYPTDRWAEGEVVGDQYELLVLPSVPPGEYRLLAGMYETTSPSTWRRLPVTGEGTDSIELARVRVQGQRQGRAPIEFPTVRNFANLIELLGAEVDDSADESITFTLFWRGRVPLPSGLRATAAIDVVNWTPEVQEQELGAAGWQKGEVHQQSWTLPLPKEATDWELAVSLLGADGGRLPILGGWMLPASDQARLPMRRADVAGPGRVRANFGNQALLLDYRIEPAQAAPGEAVEVTTRWLPLWRIDEDYSLFVHLLDAQGKVLAQRDATPVYGGLPTLRWAAGREVTDTRTLRLPADLSPGEYSFQVGLYPLSTGQRVPVLDQRRAKAGQGDRVLIGPLQVR